MSLLSLPLIKPSKSKLIETAKKYVQEEFSVQNTVNKLKFFIKSVELRTKNEKEEEPKKTNPKIEDFIKDVPLKDRIAVVLPRSAGDVLMANSLMENLQNLYPNKKIFFVTQPEFYDLINDNPFVHKVLPYSKSFENLYALEGRGDHQGLFDIAFLPHCMTQKTYSYNHNGKDKTQFRLR